VNQLVKYINGNTTVTIMEDGTKIREYEGDPIVEHPESIDVKITDYCDMGCEYCHEGSSVTGAHADLTTLYETLKILPSGVELALGGGNPLSHPNLFEFLVKLKDHGFIANITINQNHITSNFELISDLINHKLVHGIGISVVNNNFINSIHRLLQLTNNIVYHVIAGINEITIIDDLNRMDDNCKILILGYKRFGRGDQYWNVKTHCNLHAWKHNMRKYITSGVISFDNLALEQLEIKKLLTVEAWDQFYMGDDFTFSMYVDGVKREYAPTSTSEERRMLFSDMSILKYFNE
jgi:hypothetical protein